MADDAYVLLCTCRDVGEVQMVRAALEARGVPVRIEGANTHGVLGMIHGAALAPRVMVPRPWRTTAQEIAADIVGPFDDDVAGPQLRGPRIAPFRLEGSDPDDDGPAADPDDDEPAAEDADDDDAAAAAATRPRTVFVPLMIAVLGMPWGFGHVYARRPLFGLLLFALAVGAAAWWGAGAALAPFALGLIAATDVVGSMMLITRDRRALAASPVSGL